MKRLFLTIFTFALLAVSYSASAQRASFDVIPMPKHVECDAEQAFVLQNGMGIAFDSSSEEIFRNAQFLRDWVEESTGLKLSLTPNDKKAAVRFVIGLDADLKSKKSKAEPEAELTEQQQEAYTIKVDKDGVLIQARNPIGLYRASQTLRKALPIVKKGEEATIEIPYASISDEPRFSYRGVLLDCARHFFSVDMIKDFLDVMSLHGCNQFHWHLTEDQGWRIEIKSMPELAIRGSIREQTVVGPGNSGIYDGIPYGGYYTQDDCREIVKYAAERYINVIPEIDLPGHMQSALHVYPELGCTGGPYPVRTYWGVSREILCGGNPETLVFLKKVLDEVCEIFPSKIIHIGGDEVPKDRWKACPTCQAKIKELGLKDDGKHSPENQLQSYINKEIEEYMAAKGRDIVGWDEILEGGLSGKSIIMSWRGTKGGIEAAKQGHRVIMSPNVFGYIDHPQLKDVAKQPRTTGSYIVSASKVYSFEPLIPEDLNEEQQKYILGSQVNLWTEHVAYPEHAFYQLLPRLGAASEVQWCRPDQKDFESFKSRLPQLKKMYDLMGLPYCREVE